MTFAIEDDLAVPLIVGMAFQDELINAIQCKALRLKPVDSRVIAILDSFETPVCTHESANDA